MRWLVLLTMSCACVALLGCGDDSAAIPLDQGKAQDVSSKQLPAKSDPVASQFKVPDDCKTKKAEVIIEIENVNRIKFNYVECPKSKIVFSAQPDAFYARSLAKLEVDNPRISKVYMKKNTPLNSYSSIAIELANSVTLESFYTYAKELPEYCQLSETILAPLDAKSPRLLEIVHTDKKSFPVLSEDASLEDKNHHRLEVKKILDHNWGCKEVGRLYFWTNGYLASSTENEIVDLKSVELLSSHP